jgi:L-lactate dehydrogenase complex protein LldG
MDLARERILERVRVALRVPALRPAPSSTSAIWPLMGDVKTRFRTEFEAVKGEFIPSGEALRAFLGSFRYIATDGSELVRGAVGEGSANVREAELGVTGCDCLVAQIGSVVVSSQIDGRTLSVLPPVHLVIARREQLVPDLSAAFVVLRQRYGKRWPSALTVITGPSRTADIEKILVMGAHGPKRLAVFFA